MYRGDCHRSLGSNTATIVPAMEGGTLAVVVAQTDLERSAGWYLNCYPELIDGD